MSLLQSIFMGLIQGLTEFLPVSSSGHLALFKALFHVQTDTGIMFDVLLHLGTLVAVFAVSADLLGAEPLSAWSTGVCGGVQFVFLL